ncbi:MAG: hypothetical protein GY940_22875, partial [bacterium]|nr:hypothetical protein [bacterium]
MLTNDTGQGIFGCVWSSDGKYLLYIGDWNGDENFHLYSIAVNSKLTRDLTPFKGIRAQNFLVDAAKPRDVLVELNIRDRAVFDMYRVNMETGAVVLEVENPGNVRWWLPDKNFVIRAAVTLNEDVSMTLRIRDAADKPWRDLLVWPFGQSGVVDGYGANLAIAFTKDGKGLYIQSALNSDNGRLIIIDSQSGKEIQEIAAHPKCNLWSIMGPTLYDKALVMFHPKTGEVQAVGFNYLIPWWKILDPSIKKDFDFFAKNLPGVPIVKERNADDSVWMVGSISDVAPGKDFFYFRKTGELKPVFPGEKKEKNYTFAAMKPYVIKARDGLELPCYLTLPPGMKAKKLPMVV